MGRNKSNINFNFRSVGGGDVRVTVTGTHAETGDRGEMAATLGREQVRDMVVGLCEMAGLPEPWKKG
jgi:S-adenosylmethionine synthetase